MSNHAVIDNSGPGDYTSDDLMHQLMAARNVERVAKVNVIGKPLDIIPDFGHILLSRATKTSGWE